MANLSRKYQFGKRATDVIVSIVMSVATAPLLAGLSLSIWIRNPKSNPFYIQKRIGQDGKEFNLIKLRTMYPEADEMKPELFPLNEMDGPVFKLQNDPRITKLGRFLRKSGLDIPVHSFHHWDCARSGDAFALEKPVTGRTWREGFASPTLYAAFPHLYFAGQPRLAERFVQAAKEAVT